MWLPREGGDDTIAEDDVCLSSNNIDINIEAVYARLHIEPFLLAFINKRTYMRINFLAVAKEEPPFLAGGINIVNARTLCGSDGDIGSRHDEIVGVVVVVGEVYGIAIASPGDGQGKGISFLYVAAVISHVYRRRSIDVVLAADFGTIVVSPVSCGANAGQSGR